MKMTTKTYESKRNNNVRAQQKAAREASRLDRLMNSSARYMANYALLRGNLPSFNSGSILV